MRWVLVILAILGILVSGLALREHYNTGTSPCDINERWDCGVVNHSPFALFYGIPVAIIGMAGYLLLAGLAFKRAYAWMVPLVAGAFTFAVHLADIEKYLLGVWCIYCVISLCIIALMALIVFGAVICESACRPRESA